MTGRSGWALPSRPAGPPNDADGDDRPGGRPCPVLRVSTGEQADRRSHFSRVVDDHRLAVGAYPPQRRPVLVVVVGEHSDPRIGADVAQAPQRTSAFRLGVDGGVDAVAV